jgi:hypothetical protein
VDVGSGLNGLRRSLVSCLSFRVSCQSVVGGRLQNLAEGRCQILDIARDNAGSHLREQDTFARVVVVVCLPSSAVQRTIDKSTRAVIPDNFPHFTSIPVISDLTIILLGS